MPDNQVLEAAQLKAVQLKAAQTEDGLRFSVCAFYKFVTLEDYPEWQTPLKEFCVERGIYGTILLAREGFNGTVAGSSEAIAELKAHLNADERFRDSEMKDSRAGEMPFDRMKVRIKREIVALGAPEINPAECRGTYVAPEDWNAKVLDQGIPVIDTRNDYEYTLGSFPGAINPNTATFKEFKDYVGTLDPKEMPRVAMFCTGGIRCEKASAYMLSKGFEEVCHLKGGILQYLENVREDNRWEGECFVFDNRVALKKGLELGESGYCMNCQASLKPEDMTKSTDWEHGVSCRHCHDRTSEEQKEELRLRLELRLGLRQQKKTASVFPVPLNSET
ncbi:rhodanese-related sulfurtransferase [Candidatus Haliotispira prima]|uniref:tRNA uridine(34) hydroxylase n=1 Tax=Candidatus Haliotispira prima TaxID=3034016 RepID=A0ABY8MJ14_9SPIO|nr:rhodanese-related sulfurtransferase [Candidatus Haliotispira prima]